MLIISDNEKLVHVGKQSSVTQCYLAQVGGGGVCKNPYLKPYTLP